MKNSNTKQSAKQNAVQSIQKDLRSKYKMIYRTEDNKMIYNKNDMIQKNLRNKMQNDLIQNNLRNKIQNDLTNKIQDDLQYKKKSRQELSSLIKLIKYFSRPELELRSELSKECDCACCD